jgi:hypothetical protein
MKTENGCPTFPHFGAQYPDACCIDGYLWDLDKCNDDGSLYGGGDDPCPFCNFETFVEQNLDEDQGITKEILIHHRHKLLDTYE